MINSIRCMIIEAEELDRLVLHQHLKQYGMVTVIGSFGSAEEAVLHLDTQIDLVIMDMDLPGMNGMEFRKITRHIPACIFMSSRPEYAIDAFEANTSDFLIKPLRAERLGLAIQRVSDFLEMKEKSENFDALTGKNVIRIKEGGVISQIKISDIVYLEALKDYTLVITSEKKYCILDSIGSMLQKKDFRSFVRIHRSFAVPRHLIRVKNTNEVELVRQIRLPIGRAYKNNLDFFVP